MPDPNIIYLEPECCSDSLDRQWSISEDCFECEDGAQPTKYIRADLCFAGTYDAIAMLAKATEFQIGNYCIRKAGSTWLLFDEKRMLMLPQYRFDSLEEAIKAIPK